MDAHYWQHVCLAVHNAARGSNGHHALAFLAGDRPGFHHDSFESASVDEVGASGCPMITKDHWNGWRPELPEDFPVNFEETG